MTAYILLWSDASFSISGDEHINDVLYVTTDKKKMSAYITEHKIILGESHLYDSNYEIHTIVERELN